LDVVRPQTFLNKKKAMQKILDLSQKQAEEWGGLIGRHFRESRRGLLKMVMLN
jgi:hypothetical protein